MASQAHHPPLGPIIHSIERSYGLARWGASNMALFYFEYVITLGDEIEHVWLRKKTLPSILYLINRYLLVFGYIFLSLALWSPTWQNTGSLCAHFVKYEGVLTTTAIFVSELIMTLRTYALYERSKTVVFGLGLILIAQLIYSSVLISTGKPIVIPKNPAFNPCVLDGDHHMGRWAQTLGVIPLIFDAVVLVLTIGRLVKINRGVPTMKILLRDGVIYFLIIFSSNFAWVMMNFFAPNYQQTLTTFCSFITVIMVSRLTINLRTSASPPPPNAWPQSSNYGSDKPVLGRIRRNNESDYIDDTLDISPGASHTMHSFIQYRITPSDSDYSDSPPHHP
ncbi:hypothetical protein BD410DRAFT_131621 [Rickenella mellea]|uniref:DUF6533 domain-containing protein n=1 Tax=Rickenella mellea TaxID=50990 RepID=A0A4Y7Q8L1_9AGAM|nr:hypothetical protein BD410DRAFT_131621 [Rickenella mellea]